MKPNVTVDVSVKAVVQTIVGLAFVSFKHWCQRLRQEDFVFKARVSYLVSSRPRRG